jgi:hypothetical protein
VGTPAPERVVESSLNGSDLLGDEGCIVFDPAEGRGPTRVLPGESERVQPRNIGPTASWRMRPFSSSTGSEIHE